jgi:hypothetical protein
MKLSGTVKMHPFMGERRVIIDGHTEQICPVNLQHRTELIGSMVRVDGDRVGSGWLVTVTRIRRADRTGRGISDWAPV